MPHRIYRDLSYGDDPRQRLDVYAPQTDAPFPVFMMVSGGGWTTGSKDWVANIGTALAKRGIGVLIPDHRLLPDVTLQEQTQDLADVVAWITQNIGEYGGDRERIAVGGHSAGGHLISLMALDARYLAAHDLSRNDLSGIVPISGALDTASRMGDDFSPLNYLTEPTPPLLLLVADSDMGGLQEAAEAMQTAALGLGGDSQLEIIPRRNHFTITQRIGTDDDPTTAILVAWLQEQFRME